MEGSYQRIIPVIFKGDNYVSWSRTAKMALGSRNLWSHVSTEKPADGLASDESNKWLQEDMQVVSILQSSFDSSIVNSFSHIESAKELWDTLKKAYGNISNISRVYEIQRKLEALKQDGRPFNELFGEFSSLWAELNDIRPPETSTTARERHKQDMVFSLFSCLDGGYADLIQSVLRESTIPSLDDVSARIRKEESTKQFFQGNGEVAHYRKVNEQSNKIIECGHCKRKGHSKEKCWVLHPHLKPSRFKTEKDSTPKKAQDNRQWNNGNAMKANEELQFTKAEVEALIAEQIQKLMVAKESGY
ncbi:PREDICTED: uncharacterized protein LOC104824675 [Tarenaya hassleriana]|uniref:uncharacterized protein LOC104824674 n=1 Tax=Tarenaya hassleriana TaxID=28532 RepID=UPI00053C37A5|nr:PREDICTED: uncharacterized protein LOC104824674 [Tarenaya hassleriana]XP_010555087.1 PREDICTED: uncharacterized protein LOC104824675 [Tarenaya hassleriana]